MVPFCWVFSLNRLNLWVMFSPVNPTNQFIPFSLSNPTSHWIPFSLSNLTYKWFSFSLPNPTRHWIPFSLSYPTHQPTNPPTRKSRFVCFRPIPPTNESRFLKHFQQTWRSPVLSNHPAYQRVPFSIYMTPPTSESQLLSNPISTNNNPNCSL